MFLIFTFDLFTTWCQPGKTSHRCPSTANCSDMDNSTVPYPSQEKPAWKQPTKFVDANYVRDTFKSIADCLTSITHILLLKQEVQELKEKYHPPITKIDCGTRTELPMQVMTTQYKILTDVQDFSMLTSDVESCKNIPIEMTCDSSTADREPSQFVLKGLPPTLPQEI